MAIYCIARTYSFATNEAFFMLDKKSPDTIVLKKLGHDICDFQLAADFQSHFLFLRMKPKKITLYYHVMAGVNLNKSEELVTNTTAASKGFKTKQIKLPIVK